MKKNQRVRFTVEGTGVFPYDMLRYDCCWPESEARDSYKLNDPYAVGAPLSDPRRRQVTLLSDNPHAPTKGRWESFTWKVVSSEVFTRY